MADNNNFKKQSAQNTMMADIIVTELEQVKDNYSLVKETVDKIHNQNTQISNVIIQINEREEVMAKAIDQLLIVRANYMKLTQITMDMGNELRRIDEKGIEIQQESLDKILLFVQNADKPIREYIRWLTYGVCAAFLILFLLTFFL